MMKLWRRFKLRQSLDSADQARLARLFRPCAANIRMRVFQQSNQQKGADTSSEELRFISNAVEDIVGVIALLLAPSPFDPQRYCSSAPNTSHPCTFVCRDSFAHTPVG